MEKPGTSTDHIHDPSSLSSSTDSMQSQSEMDLLHHNKRQEEEEKEDCSGDSDRQSGEKGRNSRRRKRGICDSLASLLHKFESVESSDAAPHEPQIPPDQWVLGGPPGSRNSILVFKSSALANLSLVGSEDLPGYKLHVTYKVLQAETKLLGKILDCHGIQEVSTQCNDFNLLWTGSHPKPGLLRALAPHQRVNHFPRSYELTRKDRLYKNIERMQHQKGLKHFDFIPQTFLMPTEFRELCTVHHRVKGPWIVKPVASSRGRGIFIVESPHQVPLEEPVVVAKYIANPLLVAGHKCDLRLYVAVTSFDPLMIYMYEEGLVRFATVKYDSSHKQLWNPCMHLCNYSINKYHIDYIKSEDPTAENVGHKWTLSALLRHLKSEGKNTAVLMGQIEDLVIKAVLSTANSIITAVKMFQPHPNNCFELYGFDILIDDKLKPWLLEVNLSPSLNCDSPLDVRLKSAMLADLLTLVGIPAVDPILRPSETPSSKSSMNLRMKFGNCRKIHSADIINNTLPRKTSSRRLCSATAVPNSEEMKMVKHAQAQFDRRGGFVRIFPAVDSWSRYSQYLDPTTGIPISGVVASCYTGTSSHNNNLTLYTQLFPEMFDSIFRNDRPASKGKFPSLDRKRDSSLEPPIALPKINGRQDRYERALDRGHKQALLPPKMAVRESHSLELRRKIIEMLKCGQKITQCEARKTFSQYLVCVLRKIVATPDDQDEHVEGVLRFLHMASNYLRTPYNIKSPSTELKTKDRAAIVAKQLNDFLYLYNRETEMFVDKTEKPSHIPKALYNEFLEHARESDLEEVLIHQTTKTRPQSPGFQGFLKCIPNVPKRYGLKPPYKQNKLVKSVKATGTE